MTDCAPAFDPTRDPPHSLYGFTRVMRAASIVLVTLCAAACTDPAAPEGVVIDDASGSDGWRTVAAGTYNSCAIGADAAPYCWGFTLDGNCTDAACRVASTPARLAHLPAPFDTVASGGGFHCGITVDRSLWCWGDASLSSLGDGVHDRSPVPVRVAIDAPVRAVATGYSTACALTDDGAAWCWGWRLGGEPRDPLEERMWKLPRPLATDLRFVSLSVGLSACAITADGAGYCWGGGYGALGVGDRDFSCDLGDSCYRTPVPVPIAGDRRWRSISAGVISTCGVTTDDRGFCWGEVRFRGDPNPFLGLLGNGTFAGSRSPVPVAGDLRFQQIAVGTRHACGITVDGAAHCWGNNEMAELGIGRRGERFAVPQRVAGQLEFSDLALADHSCGLTVNRNLYCWGVVYGGRLGIGLTGSGARAIPTRVRPPGT